MDILTRVAVLENQVDNILDDLAEGKTTMDNTNKSLRKLERTIWMAAGAVAAVGAIIEILALHWAK